MAVTTIPWGDGSGDNIYLTYPSASGDQTVTVTSDANTGAARSKTVTFTSGVGSITQILTVNQEAGGPQYVMNGLAFWLDGIDKGGTTAWVEKINGHSFTNYGATFNADHVYFDGVDDYLMATTGASVKSELGTIEVVYENESTAGIIYMPNNSRTMLAFGIVISNQVPLVYWNANRTNRPLYPNPPTKGSVSISLARALANGIAMTAGNSSYLSGGVANEFYVGKRNYANNPGYFKGKIYSIRIYNRQLTEAEVLANLAVDNQRFNLGLSL